MVIPCYTLEYSVMPGCSLVIYTVGLLDSTIYIHFVHNLDANVPPNSQCRAKLLITAISLHYPRIGKRLGSKSKKDQAPSGVGRYRIDDVVREGDFLLF